MSIPESRPHGNIKVDSNLVKSGGFALPITELKSEIRISKYETISKFEYQMTKTFRELIQYLQDFGIFLNLGFMSFVFVSDFGFRASDFYKNK